MRHTHPSESRALVNFSHSKGKDIASRVVLAIHVVAYSKISQILYIIYHIRRHDRAHNHPLNPLVKNTAHTQPNTSTIVIWKDLPALLAP